MYSPCRCLAGAEYTKLKHWFLLHCGMDGVSTGRYRWDSGISSHATWVVPSSSCYDTNTSAAWPNTQSHRNDNNTFNTKQLNAQNGSSIVVCTVGIYNRVWLKKAFTF